MKASIYWTVLIALLAVLVRVTPAASQGDEQAFVGIGADDSQEFLTARDALSTQWEADIQKRAKTSADLAVVGASLAVSAATVDGPIYSCLPSCNASDGRFLVLAGTGNETLAGDAMRFGLASPGEATHIEIGIFDGETGGLWDQGTIAMEYTLYADAENDGVGGTQIAQWTGNNMLDNGWYTVTVANDSLARSANGNYFYYMTVRNPNPSAIVTGSFKVRTDGTLTLKPQAFAFIVPVTKAADLYPLYPNYPDLDATTYDGTWDFHLLIPPGSTQIAVWDGDMDFGSSDCLYNDSDDLDTPNTELPPWAIGTAAVSEGVATTSVACRNASGSVTSGTTTGAPADDARYPVLLRAPSVVYDLVGPDGAVYHNSNPSGNREWEQFRIDTEPFDPAMMDYHVDDIPAGIWKVQMTGMDLSNLNAWRFFNDAIGLEICGVDPEDVCVPPLSPYLIGDYVWYDVNGNGEQDESDTGIPDVIVNLVDADGNVVKSTTTSSDPLFRGQYIFEVDPGEWTVVVAQENFDGNGVLASYLPTVDYTGDGLGDSKRTQTLVDANILNYDFGYVQPVAQIGDHVWLDSNGNGVQDAGESGVEGMTVNLIGPGSDGEFGSVDDEVLQTQQTDGAGNYLFTVSPGDYVIEFVTGGLTTPNSGGNDELDSDADRNSGRSPVVTVGPNESNMTIDAGILPAQIGDTLWNDVDNDGFFEPAEGEQGIEGVVVQLNGDLDADGIVDYTSTTTTSNGGAYTFDILFEGSYSVAIIESNFEFDNPLWGMSQSTDQSDSPGDGANRMNPWSVDLASGEKYTKADFGYWAMSVGGEGCTPGYWRQQQHFWAWEKYEQADDYDSIFGILGYGKTLLGALKEGGGGEKALGRHATAALLNASSSGMSYAFSEGQVIGMVQHAYATGDFEGIKNQLATENESGCDLGKGKVKRSALSASDASNNLFLPIVMR